MTIQPDFASIDTTLLADVQGGCGGRKHRRCGGGCTIINNNIQQAAAPAPVAAPAPAPAPSVDVNVGYQQA